VIIKHEGRVTLEEAKAIIVKRGYTVLEGVSNDDNGDVHAYSVERIGRSPYGPAACMVICDKGSQNTAIHV
jgi:hypothetical protein